MKALVYTQPNEVALQERPYPQLVEGEVILRVNAVGICGSDLHAYHGHDPRRKPGLILGHELAGTVVESAFEDMKEGARVTANPLITCGHCTYCVQGRDNLCTNSMMVGMSRPGAFAEYMSIPGRSLITIPDEMDFADAALTEPAATALHALNLCMRSLVRPLAEARILIIGGGAIGMLSALLSRNYGARNVTVVEMNSLRRASLLNHTDCIVSDPSVNPPAESSFDLVIDAVGSKATRNSALSAVARGGVVMHIGLQDWSSEIDMRKLTLDEITLLGTYTYTGADLRSTINALSEGAFGDLTWVETRKLTEGAGAFRDLGNGCAAAAKLVLLP